MSERKPSELFGIAKGPVFMLGKGIVYQLYGIEGTTKGNDTSTSTKATLTCIDLKKRKEVKIKIETKNFIVSLMSQIQEEDITGLPHVMFINFDRGDWVCYPMDDDLLEHLPVLKPYVEEMKKYNV